MDFIQTSNKQADKFGSGKHGFKAGNPGAGEQATYLDPEWCDNVQQEIVNVIEGAGAAINPVAKNQMYTAIQTLIANAINAASNPDYKLSVRVATTANIASLAGGAPNTIDGVTLAANDRVLVKDQATGAQNGLYVVTTLGTGANGTWTRATDADGAGELSSGTVVAVEQGTTNADTLWMLTTDGNITIGATALTFVRKDAVTIPDASETVKGKVELADVTETRAMTDGTLAVTPLNFAAPFTGANQSLAASGYQKLPGGLILQWGKVTFSGGLASATFPIAFPAAIWGLHSSLELLTFTGSADATTVRSISTTGFTLNNYYVSVPSAYWFALGN